MAAGSSVVFSYALSFGNIVFARNKGICTWRLKFCKGFMFAFCFLNFVNLGLIQILFFILLSFCNFGKVEYLRDLELNYAKFGI